MSVLVTISSCLIAVIITVSVLLASVIDPSDQVIGDSGNDIAMQVKTASLLNVMVSDCGDSVTRGASGKEKKMYTRFVCNLFTHNSLPG